MTLNMLAHMVIHQSMKIMHNALKSEYIQGSMELTKASGFASAQPNVKRQTVISGF